MTGFRLVSFLFISLLFVGNTALAQAPKYSNEFLSIGVGARGMGMANAMVASVNDVTGGYWNPAALPLADQKWQVSLMHSEYFAGIAKYDYAAVSAPIVDQYTQAAVSFIRFGVDDIPNTTQLIDDEGNINYDKVTSFTAADYGFLFSVGRKSPKIPGLRYGGTVKVVYRHVGSFAHSWGFGLDGGVQYDRKNWKFGLMARDVTSTFNAWNFTLNDETKTVWQQTGNDIPKNSLEVTLPKVILAAGRKFNVYKKFGLYTEFDFDFTFDGKRSVLIKGDPISIEPHWGLELFYSNIVYVRFGVTNIQDYTDDNGKHIWTWQPNVGIGVRIKDFYIDYALTDVGNQSVALFSNVFSLKVDIYKDMFKKKAKTDAGASN
ncbi:MAG: hypothetical protein GC178_07550 [Flavobacteriales bacterium]|nr:hypothetical protein [Flavobacteriales bacterium]